MYCCGRDNKLTNNMNNIRNTKSYNRKIHNTANQSMIQVVSARGTSSGRSLFHIQLYRNIYCVSLVKILSSLSFWIKTHLSNLINDFVTIVAIPLDLTFLFGLKVSVTHYLPFLFSIPFFYLPFYSYTIFVLCQIVFVSRYLEVESELLWENLFGKWVMMRKLV